MAELLGEENIAARLEDSDWRREGDEIVRDWQLENFGQAMEFVNRVADVAEEANHHPDILIYGWNKVRLSHDQPFRRRPDRGRLHDGRPDRRAGLRPVWSRPSGCYRSAASLNERRRSIPKYQGRHERGPDATGGPEACE